VRIWLREHPLSTQGEQAVTPELVLRSGQPAATLDRIAAEDGYGLLVVGARGAGLSTVLLGSVATRLAARASVPVLVIGEQVRDGQATDSSAGPGRVADDQQVNALPAPGRDETLRAAYADGPGRAHQCRISSVS
jgi:Universal stress protein family